MTRRECEEKLMALALQMRAVYEEYNPAGDCLSVFMKDNGYISVDDCFFNADRQIIVYVHGNMFKTVDVTKFNDGHIRYGCPVR